MMNEDTEVELSKAKSDDEKYITLTFPSQKEMNDFLELQQKIQDALPILYKLLKKYNAAG